MIGLSKAKALSDIIDEEISIFSYPHGRNSDAAARILKSEGFNYAVTIERREVKVGDNPLLIPRYDFTDLRT